MLESSDNTNSATRAARVGQLLDDVHVRQARGEPVDCTALLAAHPDLADSLRPQLELLRQMHAVRSTHAELLARGLVTQTPDGTLGGMIGGYRVTGFIGRGGMGLVLKACDDRLRRPVALKILRPELTATGSATPVPDAATTRLEREARAAASLNHPHIVAVYSVGQDRGARYIAMEYVAGPSLAEVLRDGHCRDELCAGARWEDGSSGGVGYGSSVRPPRLTEPPVAGAPRSSASPDTGRSVALSPRTDAPASPLPAPLVRHLFRQLLEALAAAHAAGLIHRDVKPSNILLRGLSDAGIEGSRRGDPEIEGTGAQQARDQDVGEGRDREDRATTGTTGTDDREAPSAAITTAGAQHTGNGPGAPHSSIPSSLDPSIPVLKLADFGLARLQSAATQVTLAGAVLGTPEYMSPQQARGESNLDARTDLYSAGVVLYEMLTGRTPFRADTPTATLHRILNEEPADPRTFTRDVDPALASLALRLLAKEPDDRLTSATEALAILDQGRRLARRSRTRRRALRTSLLAMAAIALVLSGAWRWRPVRVLLNNVLNPDRAIVKAYHDQNYPGKITVEWRDTSIDRWFARLEIDHGAGPSLPYFRWPDERLWCVVCPTHGGEAEGNLVAVDELEEIRWRTWFGDVREWPDCGRESSWRVAYLTGGQIEPNGPYVVVATAQDNTYYPSRLSIVDACSGHARHSFWHMGHLYSPLIVKDLLGPPGARRPGILALGVNNKLDGFDQRLPGDERHYTDYEAVPVVMVLDPLHLDGLGPPVTARLSDLPRVQPVAYAFLDAPRMPNTTMEHDGERRSTVAKQDCVYIDGIEPDRTSDGRLVFRLLLEHEQLFLTPDLDLCLNMAGNPDSFFVPPPDMADLQRGAAYYRDRWHVIIRNGEYQDNLHACAN